ncbi:MAG: integrase core domain-containing protein [Pseudomonadota bacterium]|nr:integrase core domain-containing protein [Pseudomonadota bacterium]
MFNQAITGVPRLPERLSSDHDPLFQFHRCKANLRILEVSEIKTVPYVPLSHPFVERLIGTVRRELLDQVPFWGSRDLERKLRHFREYYNYGRVHASLKGVPPVCSADRNVIALDDYRWRSHCGGLYQLPAAA